MSFSKKVLKKCLLKVFKTKSFLYVSASPKIKKNKKKKKKRESFKKKSF